MSGGPRGRNLERDALPPRPHPRRPEDQAGTLALGANPQPKCQGARLIVRIPTKSTVDEDEPSTALHDRSGGRLATAAPAGAGMLGKTLLVSSADDGAAAPRPFDNDSSAGALSADGRYAVFASDADGFADGTNPHVDNVFVRDTQTGLTTLVSRSDGSDGARRRRGLVGPVGRRLGRRPRARRVRHAGHEPLRPRDRPGRSRRPTRDVWLRDVTAGTTTLISRAGETGEPATTTPASRRSTSRRPARRGVRTRPRTSARVPASCCAPSTRRRPARVVQGQELQAADRRRAGRPPERPRRRRRDRVALRALAAPDGRVRPGRVRDDRAHDHGRQPGFQQIVVGGGHRAGGRRDGRRLFDSFSTASVKSDGTLGTTGRPPPRSTPTARRSRSSAPRRT